MPLPIAVDAMGGDHAPTEIVRGALRAVNEHGIAVTLVGRREVVEHELRTAGAPTPGGIDIVDARDVIEMNEHPANAVRAKRDSSLVSSCALVAGGRARAVVSAGNSGAMLAAALFTIKRIPGIARPAIGASFPSDGGQTFILDVGANTDCKAEWLPPAALVGGRCAPALLGTPP